MSIRRPFRYRWLLYGSAVSLVHFSVVWFYGTIVDEGVVTDRLTAIGLWLTLPGRFLPISFHQNGTLYLLALFANSALWGFTISAIVFRSSRRSSPPPSRHENAT